MKTAEQWADELVERLNAESSHVWQSIMADVIREAMAVPSDAARLAVGSLLTKEDAVVLVGRAVAEERKETERLRKMGLALLKEGKEYADQNADQGLSNAEAVKEWDRIQAEYESRRKEWERCSCTPASPKTQSSTSNGAATS